MTTDASFAQTSTCSSRSLSHRLDREWAQMCRRPEVIATVRSWELTDQPVATLGEFLALAGHRVEPGRQSDELLGRLVGLARSDPMAARIVLQRILPGLLAIVKAEQERNPRINAFDILIGEAWISIAGYRIDIRPTDIAARILHDARHRAFTNGRRRRIIEEVSCDAETLNEMVVLATTVPFDDLIGVIGEATRRGLEPAAVDTVCALLKHGTAVKVAAAQQLTTRTVRYRRDHAVGRIRRLVAA